MKTATISAAIAFALLAAPAAHAQSSSTSDPNGPGQSARCDALTGAERDQCLRDENAKTQNAPADSSNASTGSDSSASDSSTSGSGAADSSAPASSDASPASADQGSQGAPGDKLPATKSE